MSVFPLRKSEPAPSGYSDAMLVDAKAALDTLDFSAEVEEIAQLSRDVARFNDAIEEGNIKLAKVRADFASYTGPDGPSVADMLLAGRAGADVLAAAGPSKMELEEERTALTEALYELRRRSESAERRIEEVRRQAKHRVFDCLRPLVEAIEHDARSAAQQVVDSFTMLRAVSLATSKGIDGVRLGEQVVSAILGPPGLVARPKQLEVPEAFQELFRGIEDKGGALRFAAFASIPAPV